MSQAPLGARMPVPWLVLNPWRRKQGMSRSATRGNMFDAEMKIYRARRAGWLRDGKEGQRVVIAGEEVLGFFATTSEAFAFVERSHPGMQPLIQEVRADEEVQTLQRVFFGARAR